MSRLLFTCLVFVILNKSSAKNDNYNFTYSMAHRCKEHICRRGYNYDTFYRIEEETFEHATVRRDNTDVSYFEMHIAIQAASNGHILLSPVPTPGSTDPVYEIGKLSLLMRVLTCRWGGGNKFTELRLNLKRNARSSAKTPGILSSIEFTAFYIKISEDGLVEFGKEGDSLPLISYYDAHTLPIKYFSFASWAGVEAKFLYDCPSSDDDANKPDSQAVEPRLSNSEELMRSLLMSKMPSIAPSPSMQVQLGIRITHIEYDPMESILRTWLAVIMSWTDDSMAWNPPKFNGTTSLKLRQGQIWRPTFFVFNSDNTERLDTKNPDLISVVYSGESTFHFQTEVTTWCSDATSTNWPREGYSCTLVIQPWEVHEKITLEIMDPTDTKMTVYADIDEMIQSEWEVNYKQMIVKSSIWNKIYANDNDTTQSDRHTISIDLKRRATSYNIVFYTPLLVLLTFVLISFWSNPLEMSRVWFYAGCSALICMVLSNMDFLVPSYTVPSILVLYITVLGGVLLALLVQVFLMTSLAEKLCQTAFMKGFLTFPLLRLVFCMPPVKISLNGGYSRQEDVDDEVCIPDGSVEEMESDNKTYGGRTELAEIIDKLMFVVYSITAASMLAVHY